MEAHLAPKQHVQVNKISSSCEICSSPHDTQYCMEDPEQTFVKYASSCTDEAGGKWHTFKPEQNNLGDTYNPSWKSHSNLRSPHRKTKTIKRLYVIDMKKDPKTPLLVGRGFLATANAVIDRRKAKIALGEGITWSVFGVKEIDLDSVGGHTPYYARKEFMNCHLPGEWEISRDAEINHFKDVLVFTVIHSFNVTSHQGRNVERNENGYHHNTMVSTIEKSK
ncbi:hypothetical protein Tco_1214771 [Tanacetum coccineum]